MIDVELIVPEGWVLVPTGPGTQRLRVWVVEQLVRRFVPEHLPRDKAGPWRKELRKQLTGAVDDAAAGGARCVLLPLAEYGGFRLPGSLLVTVLEDDPTVDPELVLAGLVADGGEDALSLDVGGGPAVRVQEVLDSRRVGRPYPTRKVAYYAAHPDQPGTWALLTFTVLTDGDLEDPAVLAVVAMFDAVVGTLQWSEHAGPVSADDLVAQLDALQPVSG
ncbi:hypothetical protein H9657_18345 [Cellulomonas sp. Sa3CUA2]|uniref:Uncharacterized protein n=1 Tax=Cellulomonas avistercoris TaxID=2762242 RepID=A0ABR8QIH7_9CELL|nr:hypothetical protein [Cellulomonas avistercoris]MBD7920237.1 hypothetical protein [Cellulomonas avistercoris]